MFKYYDIYANGRFVGTVCAFTESLAIDKAFNELGSASAYSGLGRNAFTAVAK